MGFIVICSSCHASVHIADHLVGTGKRLGCPACKTVLSTADAVPGPAAEAASQGHPPFEKAPVDVRAGTPPWWHESASSPASGSRPPEQIANSVSGPNFEPTAEQSPAELPPWWMSLPGSESAIASRTGSEEQPRPVPSNQPEKLKRKKRSVEIELWDELPPEVTEVASDQPKPHAANSASPIPVAKIISIDDEERPAAISKPSVPMARILDEENEEIGSRYDVLPEITKSDEASALSAALLYDPEDTPAARMRKKMIGGMSGWSNAGTGVRLMWLGQMTLLILMITIFLGGWIARWVLELAGPPDESSLAVLATSILIIEIVILIAMAVGCILTLVGQTFCFGAPAAKGARLFAILSLAMILLGVVTIVFGSMTAGVGLAVLANAGVGAIMGAIVAVLGTIMILAGYVLFLFFIRAVGICLKQEGLIHGAYGLMFTMGFLIAVQIIGAIILNATGSTAVAGSVRDGKPVVQDTITGATIFGCFVGILGFIVWIWFIVLLGQTRNAIRNFLDYRG